MKEADKCVEVVVTKTILMTGATGYLGSHIARKLVSSENFKVIAVKRRSSSLYRIQEIAPQLTFLNAEESDWSTVMSSNAVDIILHCATSYGRGSSSREDILEANLLLPVRILASAAEQGVKAFINTDTLLDKGVSDYSLSKSQFRDWLKIFSADLHCINVAIEHFFGPGDDPTKFVSFIIGQLLEKTECIPLTLGEQKRDFIYIDDVVDAFEKLVNYAIHPQKHQGIDEFQIGSGQSISIRDFVLLTQKIVNDNCTRLDFGVMPYRPNEPMDIQVDISRLQELCWSPQFRLEQALKLTVTEEAKLKWKRKTI